MREPNLFSWNTLIRAFSESEFEPLQAVSMFLQMLNDAAVHPNRFLDEMSTRSVISAGMLSYRVSFRNCSLGAFDLGEWVHLYVEKNKIVVDDVLGSALVDMYSKCGNIDKALELLKVCPRTIQSLWSSFDWRSRQCMAVLKRRIDYFSMMEQTGLTPYCCGFHCCIGLMWSFRIGGSRACLFCSHDKNFTVLNPGSEHYACMVDMLACKIHGDVEMGIRAAKSLHTKLAPCDEASYLLISNMFASLGDSELVAEIRLLVKELDIQKDLGCSWMTVDGAIHEFVTEDDQHPRASEILCYAGGDYYQVTGSRIRAEFFTSVA
ncbi:hypothetical protein J5N97_006451 [Dioscorea zingiberensis]|uniref:Pentatricopeptide repeat-containing protein n=1 Tax=Dioscorea zingiberensis TaxID=325984 RepID=A0A9D5HSR8_9LILI|nr:hypothetical protein J5N97_006451 [Dioscorea zingiberensis]